jgi:hypothetical protein
LFHEDSFSLDSFSTDSWMFLLEVPYFDLTGAQRVYVRHVLQSVYAMEVVERIVAVAERNNLSAIDSVDVIRAQAGDQTLVVMPRRAVTADKPQRQVRQAAPKQLKETRVAYAVTGNESLHASVEQFHVFANHSTESVVSGHMQETLSINNKPSRAAHTPT